MSQYKVFFGMSSTSRDWIGAHDINNFASRLAIAPYYQISIHDILNVYVDRAASCAVGYGSVIFTELMCQVRTGRSTIRLDKGSGQCLHATSAHLEFCCSHLQL